MNTVLNIFSVLSAFIFGVGILYCVLDVTVGKLKLLHSDREWNGLQIKDAVFLLLSAIALLLFTDFYQPY